MKFTLFIVALAIIGSIEGGTISQPAAEAPVYFSNKLASIQGAITDTINAGMDLEVMEGKLKGIVDSSSYFFKTESVTEYAVSSDAYQNGWSAAGADIKLIVKQDNGKGCNSAAECKSDVCERNLCRQGNLQDFVDRCAYDEQCASHFCLEAFCHI